MSAVSFLRIVYPLATALGASQWYGTGFATRKPHSRRAELKKLVENSATSSGSIGHFGRITCVTVMVPLRFIAYALSITPTISRASSQLRKADPAKVGAAVLV